MLVVAQETAGANGRDVIEVRDLPITRGLRDRMREFRRIDRDVELGSRFEVEEELPLIAGGLSLPLTRTSPIIDPIVRNPQTEQWERAQRVFDLLL